MKGMGSNVKLDGKAVSALKSLASTCRGDILTMTTIAGSGHPGGAMSCIDMLISIYELANVDKDNVLSPSRDRVVVSNGHISPGVYSILGRKGFIDIEDALCSFRLVGSQFEGHIERDVLGVEWSTGNLGQGLSAACGFALSGQITGDDFDVYVLMGDGEQQKGQLSEARRFAFKYGLNNITAFVDYNGLQISGDINDVMPQNIRQEYVADGWHVIEIDGHNFYEIFEATNAAKKIDRPVCILAKTIMGKGVGFMEHNEKYHGSTLTFEQFDEAMSCLGLDVDLNKYLELRKKNKGRIPPHRDLSYKVTLQTSSPREYDADASTDNRSAMGAAVSDMVHHSRTTEGNTPVVVFDCDLSPSVKTGSVLKDFPECFFQAGIQEHHTAVCAGAVSINGIVPFFADFGVFAIDETYNQQRLNDINHTNLKVCATHCGLDVGEDGKTHQSIDYIGLLRNLFNFRVIVPGDPNQTYKAVSSAAKTFGNYFIGMGRSKVPVILNESGAPFFGEGYEFEYGRIDKVRSGKYALFTNGVMLHRALRVRELLLKEKIEVAVLNVSCPLSLDVTLVMKYAEAGIIFSYEDHYPYTGLGGSLMQAVATEGVSCRVQAFGPTTYGLSGSSNDIFEAMGLSPDRVAEKIAASIKVK